MVDLPEPDLPTIATVSLVFAEKLMFFKTFLESS